MKLSKLCEILENQLDVSFSQKVQNDICQMDIFGLNSLTNANENELSYCDGDKNLQNLLNSRAGAILVSPSLAQNLDNKRAVVVENPHLAFAVLSKIFDKNLRKLEAQNSISNSSVIMQNAYIGSGVTIGDNSLIMPGAYIGNNVKIGKNCIIHPNVVIYDDCIIGDECHLLANCVIGSDGFGYAHTKDGKHAKIYHNGNVVLGDFVEIGSCTTIDRGVFESTIIESYSKIDNLVQIGHNCKIGFGSIIVSQSGLAGSTKLGRNVVMGGQCGTAGHIEVGNFAQFAARSGITKNLDGDKKYGGYPAIELNVWMKNQAKLSRILKDKDDK